MASFSLPLVGPVPPVEMRAGRGERLLAACFRGLCRCIEQAAELYGISDSADELLVLHAPSQGAAAWRTPER